MRTVQPHDGANNPRALKKVWRGAWWHVWLVCPALLFCIEVMIVPVSMVKVVLQLRWSGLDKMDW